MHERDLFRIIYETFAAEGGENPSMVLAASENMFAPTSAFQRPRPSQSDDPDLWRQGKGNASFPSGEVATMAAFVTPVILEYRDEYPAVWGLSVLPIYMANARMASLAHWTSDVIAGAAVGTVAGKLAFGRETPLVLGLTKDGTFIGYKHRF
jgi:undecaprenyl-diphosphatase